METEEILERLIDAGVVEAADGQIAPTEEFAARRTDLLEGEDDSDRPEWVTSDVVNDDDGFLATVTAISEFADGMGEEDVVAAARAFDRLEDPPTASGAPEGFVPLYQEDLQGFLAEHAASVIYVWKPGSSSCEEMAETLGRLHERPVVDETIGLGAICVADGADLLREEYDVGVLPTTLYFVGQSVDMRNVGVRGLDYVEEQLEVTVDVADGSVTTDSSA